MQDSGRSFDVVLVATPRQQRVLHSSSDADGATVAFHAHLRQLRGTRATGELLVRVRNGEPRTVLREPVQWRRPSRM